MFVSSLDTNDLIFPFSLSGVYYGCYHRRMSNALTPPLLIHL